MSRRGAPLLEQDLPNGLRFELFDRSRHYFGGYWRLSLEARCLVPLSAAGIADEKRREELKRYLGDPVPFVRSIEQMAVPVAEVEQQRAVLQERLTAQMQTLLTHPRFAERFIDSEYRQRIKRSLRGIPSLS